MRKEKTATDQHPLPTDLANGLIFTLLKNVRPDGPADIRVHGSGDSKTESGENQDQPCGPEEPFSVGGGERKAMHYVLKIEIGGVAGAIAPLVGKQPADISHMDFWRGSACLL